MRTEEENGPSRTGIQRLTRLRKATARQASNSEGFREQAAKRRNCRGRRCCPTGSQRLPLQILEIAAPLVVAREVVL